jgi:hypothetical protein
LASVTYLGNKTTHLWVGKELDPAVYIPGTCSGKPCSSTANTSQRQLLYLQNSVDLSDFSGLEIADDGANVRYQGLLLSVQHRFSHHFTLLTNYTYSHCISDSDFTNELTSPSYENPSNRSLDRGSCGFDIRHVFNTSLVARSPETMHGWAGLC